jgi:hypothetical protein
VKHQRKACAHGPDVSAGTVLLGCVVMSRRAVLIVSVSFMLGMTIARRPGTADSTHGAA